MLGEARTFSFVPQPVNSSWLNPATHTAPFVASQEKVKDPSGMMGKMTFSGGLLTHPEPQNYPGKPPLPLAGKLRHTRKVVNTHC